MTISWMNPVGLQFPESGKVLVRGPQDALDYLLTIWPTEGSALYQKCRVVCMEALEGVLPIEEARMIFRSAAEEAGIASSGSDRLSS